MKNVKLSKLWDSLHSSYYLIALLGLIVFYGLEQIANLSRQHDKNNVIGELNAAKMF